MADTTDFLRSFLFEGGLLQLSVGHPDNAQYVDRAPRFTNVPEDSDVYFSPALRIRKGSTKADVLGSKYLWVDVDDPVLPDTTFPASAVVFSGNGNHLYWRLDVPVTDVALLEQLNKILIGDIPTADAACWNSNRLMRVPGTWNVHRQDKPPRMSELRTWEAHSYSVEDIQVLGRMDERLRHIVRTGDSRQWNENRSERDWYVINQLIIAGATDELITFLFDKQPVGDKFHEQNGERYLDYTIKKARDEIAANPPDISDTAASKAKKERRKGFQSVPIQIVEKEDGYYMIGTTSRRISTFTLQPQVLLQGMAFGATDALVCDVKAGEDVWPNVTFSRAAFNSITAMDKACPVADWQWLGTDTDVRQLLPFLMERLKESGNRKVAATPVLGMHKVGERLLFLSHQETISSDQYWPGSEGPLTWLPMDREHPKSDLSPDLSREQLNTVIEYLPKLNEACAIWTMIGWHAAAVVKPWLEEQGVRFPILNITGTRGSGKTTLNKNVLMKLFSGQQGANIYDAGTTRFVRLALLGSSNALPIAFGEFRYESVEQFIRTVLLSYDTGHDPRGRADQTTQDWPLLAPYTIDGEDVIQDPAARERILIARMRPETVDEGSDAWHAYREFSEHVPPGFARFYIQTVLNAIETGKALDILNAAKAEMFKRFPGKLPDRVRSNYAVALFGIRLYAHVTGAKIPNASVFEPGLGELVNMNSGRSRTLVDEYVESLINYAGQHGHKAFNWKYDAPQRQFWFQMSSAHGWWLMQRKRQSASTLQRDAIVAQLREAPYSLNVSAKDGVVMYGIDMHRAQDYGLDIPEKLGENQVTIQW